MIPFTLDSRSFLKYQDKSLVSHVKELEKLWRNRAGVLFCSEDEKNELNSIFSSLPDNVKKRIDVALKELPIHELDVRAISSYQKKEGDQYSKVTEPMKLIISAPYYWDEILRYPEEGEKIIDPRRPLSVCRAGNVLSSDTLADIEDKSSSPIIKTDKVQDIWSEKFSSLMGCKSTKVISIVDRYALKNVWSFPSLCESGLAGFINQISKQGIKKHITVFASKPLVSKGARDAAEKDGLSPEQWVRDRIKLWEDNLREMPIKNEGSLTVKLVDDKFMRDFAHDRYIRAGRACWEIGCGLEIFERSRQHDNISLTLKTTDEVLRKNDRIERKLNQRALGLDGIVIEIY